MAKARSGGSGLKNNVEGKVVPWPLPVTGSSQTLPQHLLHSALTMVLWQRPASCSPCLFSSLPRHTFALQFPASLAVQCGHVTRFQPMWLLSTAATYSDLPYDPPYSSPVCWINVNTQPPDSLEDKSWRWQNLHQPGSHLTGTSYPWLDLHE